MTLSISGDAPFATLPVRQRLPADVRVNQILDAALEAFAKAGFASTRIDDIARLAGLSKGGIYTHFKSKDDIFEALLARSVTPLSADEKVVAPDEAVTVDLLVERVIDRMYNNLADRRTVLTLRLLFADGARVPERVALWQKTAIDPYLAMLEDLVHRGVAHGTLREGVMTRAPWMLIAPGLFATFWQLIHEQDAAVVLARQHSLHIEMARELLQPLAAA